MPETLAVGRRSRAFPLASEPGNGYPCDFMIAKKPAARDATTIDGYLKLLTPESRATLEKLRATIRAIVPRAEECISYKMPAFRLDGSIVAGFLATSKGYSYFPFSGSTLRTLAREVSAYSQTKSALHFSAVQPLPATLVRKLLKARIAETK
jgi:uncharacterized protein YdhG (YjbR/CyaY superfamily)